MIRILITGGSGLVGSSLIRHLTGSYEIFAPSHLELDLNDEKRVDDYFKTNKIDVCIHAAAIVFGLGGHLKQPDEAIFANTRLDQNVFNAVRNNKLKKFIYIGTVAAYGFPYAQLPLREEDFYIGEPHDSEYGYASAKRAASSFCKVLSDAGIPSTYCILTNVYGPNDRFNVSTGHVIPSLIAKASQASSDGEPLSVWGNPETTRDFIFVDDISAAIKQLIDSPFEGIVNLSTGIETSMLEVAEGISKRFGISKIQWEVNKPQGIPKRVVSNKLLKSVINFKQTEFEAGLDQTVEWYKKFKEETRN